MFGRSRFFAVPFLALVAVGFWCAMAVAQDNAETDAQAALDAVNAKFEAALRDRTNDEKFAEFQTAVDAFIKTFGANHAAQAAELQVKLAGVAIRRGDNTLVLDLTAKLLQNQTVDGNLKDDVMLYRGVAAINTDNKALALEMATKVADLNARFSRDMLTMIERKWPGSTQAQPQAQPEGPLAEGKAPPAWELATLDGKAKVSLDSLKGKWVILDFWASWCGPCKNLMRSELAPLFEKYGHRADFEIVGIGINSRDTIERQQAYIDETGYKWTKVFDTDNRVTAAYGVRAIPYLVLLDPQGNVVVFGNGTIGKIKEILEAKLKAEAAPAQGGDDYEDF